MPFSTRWPAPSVWTMLAAPTVAGPMEIDYEALHLPGDPDQTLFIYRAPNGDTRSAEALTLLASWNAQTTTHTGSASEPSHRTTAP
jgi:hypothetical protein